MSCKGSPFSRDGHRGLLGVATSTGIGMRQTGLGLCLMSWALCVSASEPRLVCDEPTFNFGEVPVGIQPVTHIFMLRNAGNVTATITNVYSGCGCTTTLLTRSVLPPGESEPLTVRFDLAGRQGAQNRLLYVNWNSPNGQPLRLSLTGMVFTAVKVEPPYVYLNNVPGTGLVERVVRIYDPSGTHAFRISEVGGKYSGFTAHLETVVEGHDYRLIVTSAGPRSPGTITGLLKMETDRQEFPMVAVPVCLRVPGSVENQKEVSYDYAPR